MRRAISTGSVPVIAAAGITAQGMMQPPPTATAKYCPSAPSVAISRFVAPPSAWASVPTRGNPSNPDPSRPVIPPTNRLDNRHWNTAERHGTCHGLSQVEAGAPCPLPEDRFCCSGRAHEKETRDEKDRGKDADSKHKAGPGVLRQFVTIHLFHRPRNRHDHNKPYRASEQSGCITTPEFENDHPENIQGKQDGNEPEGHLLETRSTSWSTCPFP